MGRTDNLPDLTHYPFMDAADQVIETVRLLSRFSLFRIGYPGPGETDRRRLVQDLRRTV